MQPRSLHSTTSALFKARQGLSPALHRPSYLAQTQHCCRQGQCLGLGLQLAPAGAIAIHSLPPLPLPFSGEAWKLEPEGREILDRFARGEISLPEMRNAIRAYTATIM